MSYVKLDTGIARNVKLARVSGSAHRLYIQGLCYCQDARTDGRIPLEVFPVLGLPVPQPEWADELVTVGCWILVEGGYVIHDYHEWNDSAEERANKTRFSMERKRLSRARQRTLQDAAMIVQTQPEPRRISGENSPPVFSVPQTPEVPASGRPEVPTDQGHTTPPNALAPTPVPVPVERGRPLIDSPVRQMATDARYGFIGPRFRVPASFHQELVGRYGGDFVEAEAALQKWYRSLEASMLPGEAIPNIYQFINPRFAAWVEKRASVPPAAPKVRKADDQRQGVTDDFREQLNAAQERKAAK